MYLPYIARMIDMLNDWPVFDFDITDIRTSITSLSPGARIMQLVVVKNLVGYGRANDLVEQDPTEDIKVTHDSAQHEL